MPTNGYYSFSHVEIKNKTCVSGENLEKSNRKLNNNLLFNIFDNLISYNTTTEIICILMTNESSQQFNTKFGLHRATCADSLTNRKISN